MDAEISEKLLAKKNIENTVLSARFRAEIAIQNKSKVTSNSFFYSRDQCIRNAFKACFWCTCNFYLTSHIFRVFDFLRKRAFLNLKGGEKVQIFGFFETQKLDFLRNKLSVEKTFLSQEAGMIRLSFD